jgi:hypothetical protein
LRYDGAVPCAHEICKCEDASFVWEDVGYCSETCARQKAGEDCECEHEECLARPFRPRPSPPGGSATSLGAPTLGGD